MKRVFGLIFWSLVFVALVAAFDQLAVRLESEQPALRAGRAFYMDLRVRVLRLVGMRQESIESIIEGSGGIAAPAPAAESDQKEAPPEPAPSAEPARSGPPPEPSPLPRAEALKEGAAAEAQRYIYIDASGRLQFADSLQEVPERFRSEARPMER